MEVIFDSSIIKNALIKVMKSVGIRSLIPSLSYILIKTEENNKVSFYTTDLELGIKCYIDADIIEEGSACVSAKVLSDLVKNLNEDEIKIKYNENKTLELSTSKSKYNLQTIDIHEFPIMPVNNNSIFFKIPQIKLKEILKSSIIAIAGRGEPRLALTGIYISIDNNNIIAVSTDGRRLVKAVEPINNNVEKGLSAIIPQKTAREIYSILEENYSDINITLSEGLMFLELNYINIFSRIIDGKFPNYDAVIPKSSSIKAVINRKNTIEAIKRSLIMSDKNTANIIKAKINEDGIKIFSNCVDMGDGYEEILFNEFNGESIEVAFNGLYMLDALNVIEEENVNIYMNSSEMPILIKSINKDNYDYIVMPVRISNNR